MYKGKNNTTVGMARSFIICFCLSALNIILFSLVSAFFLSKLNDPTTALGIFSLGTMILSAIVSGILCIRIKEDGGLKFPALVSLAVVLIMLLINVIISQGKVSGGAFMNYACYLGSYVLAAFLGRRKKRSGRHRK